ncbi:hypothetical protein RRG08_010424 [Elysia crispata]|uniref:Uncharacterized protein n=1 Tax=Elysia crispata TaxID=231223 RepID=A0AAE0YTK6_9GAST|nr:hypothetical protein RRG08_010424 [Elysia crispata]
MSKSMMAESEPKTTLFVSTAVVFILGQGFSQPDNPNCGQPGSCGSWNSMSGSPIVIQMDPLTPVVDTQFYVRAHLV